MRRRRGREKLTVLGHGLSKGWADAEDDSGKDVLEAGYKEESCVFGVFNVGFLLLYFWGDEPG